MLINTYCLGDTGSINIANNYIKDLSITDSRIIQVGDFGIGFRNKSLELDLLTTLNDTLKRSNNQLLVIRGNHDNPSYFNGEWVLSNIQLLKDYTVIDDILLIGGAISIDRCSRVPNISYWSDEALVYNDMVESLKDITKVITHTCPSFVNKYTSKQLMIDMTSNMTDANSLFNDCLAERAIMDKIYEQLIVNNNISKWYYGHFHNDLLEYINNIEFRCIDECHHKSINYFKQL